MLRPDVAAQFQLTSHATRFYVGRLGREIDLTKISVEEAEQLLALEGGFEWLRRKKKAQKKAGPVGGTTGPAGAEN